MTSYFKPGSHRLIGSALVDESFRCLFSARSDPIDRMLSYFKSYFNPSTHEEGYSLAIQGGRNGARLTHVRTAWYHPPFFVPAHIVRHISRTYGAGASNIVSASASFHRPVSMQLSMNVMAIRLNAAPWAAAPPHDVLQSWVLLSFLAAQPACSFCNLATFWLIGVCLLPPAEPRAAVPLRASVADAVARDQHRHVQAVVHSGAGPAAGEQRIQVGNGRGYGALMGWV